MLTQKGLSKKRILRVKNIREQIKERYIQGMEIIDICTSLNITRAGFYYHKNADLKKGINWDNLLLESKRDMSSIKDKEAVFIATLIASFEKFMQKSKENGLSPEALDKLHQYAQTYWRLKAPKNDEFSLKSKLIATARDTINEIANIALKENNEIVADFLAKNADTIINKVFKDKN